MGSNPIAFGTARREPDWEARPESKGEGTADEAALAHQTTMHLDPLPLNRLCPVCFGAGAETAFLCLDANFQQNTVKSHGRSIMIKDRDLRNCQLFVDAAASNPNANEVYPLLKKLI